RLAEELRHHRTGGDTARQRMTVLPVGAGDVVIGPKSGEAADGHGLLADVEVAEPADLTQAVGLTGLLLEAADQHHLPQPAAVFVSLGRIEPAGSGSSARGGRT